MQMDVTVREGKRVLTTVQIAEAYGSVAKTVTRNFQRNQQHFEQGVHYFALTGEALKQFKGERQNDATLKFVSVLYLWTEQGAFLLAKSLNSDRAWQAYNMLIDSYYKIIESPPQIDQAQTLAISHEQFLMLEGRVEALEKAVQAATLHTGEQRRLRNAVTERVYQLADKQPTRQVLFRALYGALKTRYQVGSYRDLRQCDLQDALRFVYGWKEGDRA